MINMKNTSTEEIVAMISENGNLPFYVFVDCNEIDTYDYSCVFREINNISIDYIWSDDDNRTYVKSWNEEDLIEDFYENVTAEWLDEHGFDSKTTMSNDDCDRLYQMCDDMVQSLDWQKCIIAWS